jgi:hypothetical protein
MLQHYNIFEPMLTIVPLTDKQRQSSPPNTSTSQVILSNTNLCEELVEVKCLDVFNKHASVHSTKESSDSEIHQDEEMP